MIKPIRRLEQPQTEALYEKNDSLETDLICLLHRYRKEQIPDSSCSLIDRPLPTKRENAGALGHWPKKKIAYLFPYKFANFENQNLLA